MRFSNFNGEWRINDKKCEISPIQQDDNVPRVIAEEAYKEYAIQYGTQQSLNRLNERGGFGAAELAILLFERIQRLQQAIEADAKEATCPYWCITGGVGGCLMSGGYKHR